MKSKLFVMTLRDHFQDKLLETKLTARKIKVLKAIEDARASRLSFASRAPDEQQSVITQDHISEDAVSVDSLEATKDDWAYHYISVAWLQPIMEAFDDDGSGYITVTEVNRFTETMPKDLKWTCVNVLNPPYCTSIDSPYKVTTLDRLLGHRSVSSLE